jgi:hypothetical protein
MTQLPTIDPEFKELIPPLSTEEYAQLEANILAARECFDPIITWENTIVDGFNRFCICATHGVGFRIEEAHFNTREEAKLWIIENQLGRRNLTDAARIELALTKEELLRERAKKKLANAGRERHGQPFTKSSKSENTDNAVNVEKELAESAGVSQGTIHSYKRLKSQAPPELFDRVKSGSLKIGTAHKMLTRNIFKELKAADSILRHVPDLLATNDPSITDPLLARLLQVTEKMHLALEYVKEKQPC